MGNIIKKVAAVIGEQYLEACRQMVVLQDAVITVSNGERVLCAHYKLIRVSRVLKVMDQASNEGRQVVMLLQAFLHVPKLEEEVEALHTIQDVGHVMIVVLFEIAQGHLSGEVQHHFHRDVIGLEEVVVLEDLESQELKSVLGEPRLKRERIKLYRFEVCCCLTILFADKVSLADHLQEL